MRPRSLSHIDPSRSQVGKKLGVPPFYLAIFVNGKDIGDIDQTMRDVGISPNDTVFVRNVADRQTDSDGPEDEPVPNRVDGFGGTLLGRSSLNTKVEQPAVQEDPPAAAQEKIAKEGMRESSALDQSDEGARLKGR